MVFLMAYLIVLMFPSAAILNAVLDLDAGGRVDWDGDSAASRTDPSVGRG